MEVLLAGNTRYITAEFVKHAFPDCHVVVLGAPRLRSSRGAGLLSLPGQEAEGLRELLQNDAFDRVVWFGDSLTPGAGSLGALEKLRVLLQGCAADTRMVVLSAPPLYRDGLLADTEAALCRDTAAQLVQVTVPWLADAAAEGDLLGAAFAAQQAGQSFLWPGSPETPVCFLAAEDLAELLYRLFENWQLYPEPLTVPDCFGLTMGTLAERVQALWPDAPAPEFSGEEAGVLPPAGQTLRRELRWSPRYSILDDLPAQKARWLETQQRGPAGGVRGWMRRHPLAVRLAELLLGCLAAELLTAASGVQMQFKLIDFRLLYIVLLGTIYGMQWGIAAAGLESLCLIAAYARQDVGWLTLFYEPANWVAFIGCFTAGAVCGYVRDKSRDMLAFAEQENRRLRNKFGVLRQLYQETVRRNQELRRQIVSSRDSFGKIFRATQELDVAQPKEVFFKAVKVLEELMENQSIAIYSVGANKDFARLEAASRPIAAEAEQSLRMETLTPALPALQRGEVWVNTEFLPGLPSFLAAVWEQDGPVLLLEVRRADYEQMTLYYQNLFRVLCGLIRSALLRCLQIQRMRQNEQCVPGTCRLLRAEDFRREAAVAREMEQAHVACHQLLRLERTRRTPAELDRLLAGRIRENDAAGLLEDGCVWLLLTQATPETLPFVVRRLAAAGLKAQRMKELPCI